MVVGFVNEPKYPVDWKIKNLDSGETLLPPYPIADNGVRVTIGGALAEQQRFGFQDPITQWTNGKARVITFSSVLFTLDNEESITGKFAAFEKLTVKDDSLGRPPVCVFTLGSGSLLSEMCMIESIDPVIKPVRSDGEPREIELSIVLRRYRPFSQSQLDATKPTKESYYLIVRSIEASYEAIARRYYGNPMFGDRLRKRHPAEPFAPTVGAKISVPARAVIMSELIRPAFHALSQTNADALANFQDVLDERNKRQVIF